MISLIGASGNVGRITLALLVKAFGKEKIRVASSPLSIGKILQITGCNFLLEDYDTWEWQENDIAIFNTESDVSASKIPFLLDKNIYIVDSSSQYRMTGNLIVPGVNLEEISTMQGKLFSHANCIVSPIARTLKPLVDNIGVKRVIISTYQSSSGAGKKAQNDLINSTKTFMKDGIITSSDCFPRSLVFNVIPQIGDFDTDGNSSEEKKIVSELQKLLGFFPITATSVRVPVIIGHSVSLSIQLKSELSLATIKDLMQKSDLSIVESYITPVEVMNADKVFIGRIRKEKDWLHLWIVSDNLRIGAALDTFEIVKYLLKRVIPSN
jgi:aspartate-semialdehyde dehydrogenase